MATCSPERTRFAELIRAFYSGRITNWDFEDDSEELWNDTAAFHVFHDGIWFTYSDVPEHRFTDKKRLSRDDRRTIARWILFLKSGQPYKWPVSSSLPVFISIPILFSGLPLAIWKWDLSYLPIGVLILIAIGIPLTWIEEWKMNRAGDISMWPFIDRTDYEEALLHPPYLIGTPTR